MAPSPRSLCLRALLTLTRTSWLSYRPRSSYRLIHSFDTLFTSAIVFTTNNTKRKKGKKRKTYNVHEYKEGGGCAGDQRETDPECSSARAVEIELFFSVKPRHRIQRHQTFNMLRSRKMSRMMMPALVTRTCGA